MLTLERLRAKLSYDSASGAFSRCVLGKTIVGTPHPDGGIHISVDKHIYKAHRLAWFYVHGEWPAHEIDHIDGNRANNAIANLRLATHAENKQNLGVYTSNKSGYPGVSWNKANKKWMAKITSNYTQTYLGSYGTKEEAWLAYCAAKREKHKFNPVHRLEGVL